jgi:hypothetical protein
MGVVGIIPKVNLILNPEIRVSKGSADVVVGVGRNYGRAVATNSGRVGFFFILKLLRFRYCLSWTQR